MRHPRETKTMARQETPSSTPVIIVRTPEDLAKAEAMAATHEGPIVIVIAKDARIKEPRL
jgi:hypothetical protein